MAQPHRKKTAQRQWYRMDLHLHTPASVDYKTPNVTYLDFLKKAEEKNLDVIAFADHNTAQGYARYLEEVESLELLERLKRLRDDERKQLDEYRRLREKMLILPGFEFTATLGFHILGIFPPETTVRELEHLLLMLHVPPDKLDQGSGEVGATTDALTAYRMITDAGGMAIAAHANSSHGVAMPGFDFGGQTRIAYTQDENLSALEVTDLDSKSRRRTAAFFSGTKPEYPRKMHCIQGSDAHKLVFDPKYKNEMGVGERPTEIMLDELSFDAIKAVFAGNDFARTRPARTATEEPFDPLRDAREQGDTLIQAFHEKLIEKRGVARTILEDVVALANTNGGTLYIGASASTHQLVAGVDRPDHAIAELRAAIAKAVTPPLDTQIEVLKSQGKNVLQVIVPRGSDVPYALESSYIYVRSEGETGLAVRDEIIQLVRDTLAVEFAANLPAPKSAHQAEPVVTAPTEAAVTAIAPTAETALPVPPPRTGVEIVTSDVRKGVWYYSVRDLRNERIVHNVTLASARRLWQYAISEREKNPCDPAKISWLGEIAIVKAYKRGGKVRYDFVQRSGEKLFVYYGVTEDGIHGPWRKLVEGDESAEARADLPEYDETLGFGEPIGLLPEIQTVEEMPSATLPPFADSIATETDFTAADESEEPSFDLYARSNDLLPPEVLTSTPMADLPVVPVDEPVYPSSPALDEAVAPISQAPAIVPAEPAFAQEEPTPPSEPAPTATVSAPAEPQPLPVAPAPIVTSKTKAQEWREKLDRAIAEAHAKRETAEKKSGE